MKDKEFRARYLVLFDMVNILVELCQNKFATLATTSRKDVIAWSFYPF